MFLYIHIPFCQSKCKYCSFASFAWMNSEIGKYITHLKLEISNFLEKNNQKIESIYFWWWTPSLLSVDLINEIIEIISNNSLLSENIEITLESNPENLTCKYIKWLKEIWINRLSIWVQSLNNEVLEEIGRRDRDIILSALDNIKEIGLENVGIDFIIWLPHEKKLWVSANILEILEKYQFIKHVSIYMLEWNYPDKWRKISISQDGYLSEYEACIEVLRKHQINQYEISNFAVEWYECKHNRSYWNHSEYRWFWVSAASFVWNRRFANSAKLWDYYRWILDYKEELSEENIELERIMFDIRTSWIDVKFIKNKTKLKEFLQEKYLEKSNSKVKLTTKWIMICNYIIKELI